MVTETPPNERHREDSLRSVSLFMPSFAGGGAERATILLARGLSDAGLEVELIVPTTAGPLFDYAQTTGAAIVDLGTRRVRYSVARLARHIRRRRPDALIVVPNDTIVYAYLAFLLGGATPLLVSVVHNSWDRYRPMKGFQPRLRFVARAFSWAVKRAHLVVSVSEGVRQSLLEGAGVDSITITDPIDLTMVRDMAGEAVEHRWLGQGYVVIIGVGRLTEQKDFHMLLRAFSLLLQHRPSAKLLILGDGHLREELERLIAEYELHETVELLGFVDNPWAYMARADVLAMSSRFEGLGLVLVEALACGTAVVSTDANHGPREVLDHGRLGKLVPVGDPHRMADALLQASSSPKVNADIKELESKYSPDKIAFQFLEAMEEAMSQRTS